MASERAIGVIVIGAGALYLLSRPGAPLAGAFGPPGTPAYMPPISPTVTPNAYQPSPGAQTVYNGANGGPGPGNTPAGTPGGAGSAFPAQAVIGAATSAGGAGIAAATGLVSGSAALATALTAGIGAAAVFLAYGIIDKGWFRGGEEGITVNPERDTFFAQFAAFDYYRDSSNPPGFYGLNLILVTAAPDQQASLQNAIHQARTDAAFKAAGLAIVNVVKQITPAGWEAIKAAQNAYRTGAALVPGTSSYLGV